MAKQVPPAVSLPRPDQDTPAWALVSVIAVVGFVVGVAWPRVFGVRLGPSAPGEAAAAASASASASAAAESHPPAPSAHPSVSTKPPAAAASAVAARPAVAADAPEPKLVVRKGTVLSCKTDAGEARKGKACGKLTALDAVVMGHMRKLSSCKGVGGESGKLSVLVHADFSAEKLTFDLGKSTNLATSDAASACLKASLSAVKLGVVPHLHESYTVAYSATFGAAATEDDRGKDN